MDRKLFRSSAAAAVFAAVSTVSVAQVTIVSDNFDSLDGAEPAVGNDWLFQKVVYSDADCVTYDGVYAYTDPNPQLAQNRNYANVAVAAGGSGGGANYPSYSGASLESADNLIAGALSLGVREDNYAAYDPNGKNPCHKSRVFKSSQGSYPSGLYTITAKTAFSRYGTDTENAAGSQTGVFFTVYDIDNGYNVLFEAFRDNSVTRADGVVEVSESFQVDMGTATNVQISAGFYSQVNQDSSAFALWDDYALVYGSASQTLSRQTGDPTRVPVMPIGGLLGLIALIGWLGARRKA